MMGGGDQTSNSVSRFEPPKYVPWENWTNAGTAMGTQGLPIYTGQTVAPLSQQAQIGTGMLTSLATQGSPLYDTAQTNLQGTLQGDFADPYATQMNPYAGMNPYLQQMVDQSNRNITDAFRRGTAAQTDAAATRQGAYGGSGWQEAQKANEEALGRTLAQNTSGLLGANYNQSANLAESALNRAEGSLQNERERQIRAAGMAPGFQQADMSAIQGMMGGGDAVQNYQQQLLNAAQSLFGQQAQAPWQLSDLLGSIYSRASGQAGGTSSQIIGPGMSPLQGLLGAGALGYGMFGS